MLLHATSILVSQTGVLLIGPSGSGKSDLALRMIDRGASLVSDDYTELYTENGLLIARPPARLAGKIEIRGVGIVQTPYTEHARIGLAIELDDHVERLPERQTISLLDINLISFKLAPLEISAALKVEALVRLVEQGMH